MNKKQLIARVQAHMGVGCTRETARAALDAVLASIVRLSEADTVQLHHFGRFSRKIRSERVGHHPITNEAVLIRGGQQLHFSPSAKLLGEDAE